MCNILINFQIVLSVCMVCAFALPAQDQHYEQDQRHRETTTWIPILKYNKEQGQDGSYKTQ